MPATKTKTTGTTTDEPEFVPPRFGTPRNPDRETLGHELTTVGDRLRRSPMPWQQHVGDVALEIDPETGDLWYEEVIVTVPRQSGKTTLILLIFVWRCITLAKRIGAQTTTYIAQSLKMGRRKLEFEFAVILRAAKRLTEIPQGSRARPSKSSEWKLSMNNNGEHILFGTWSRVQLDPPTEDAAHGDVLDMSVIDEAWDLEDDDVEQGVDAANITRRSPQTWIISTAGNKRSRFLARKVLAGRQAINDPNSRTAYFEWSVGEDEQWDDPEVWKRRLPALGFTITLARLLARLEKAKRNPDEVAEDGYEPGIAGFKRGYLNIWPSFPKFGDEEDDDVIGAVEWEELGRAGTSIVSRPVFGVAAGGDGRSAAIAVGGINDLGVAQVELVEAHASTLWVEKALRDRVERNAPPFVAWNNSGALGALLGPDVRRSCEASDDTKAMPLSGSEWAASCHAFVAAVRAGAVHHVTVDGEIDPKLAASVVAGRQEPVAAGWRWSVEGESAALMAVTAAYRAIGFVANVAEEKPRRSAYEDNDLMVV